MDHADHVRLIRDGVVSAGSPSQPDAELALWADLGSGRGAFTLALADLLGPRGRIYSVDRDGSALREQQRQMQARFPDAVVQYVTADFTRPLDLPSLDGILLANSLHFQRQQEAVLCAVRAYLKPGGRLVLVEYNIERGNPAVPYPAPFAAWQQLARRAGFAETQLLATRPSQFLKQIYSAVSW